MGWSQYHKSGLIHCDRNRTSTGYTLIANSAGNDAWLLDNDAHVCHQWHGDEGISYGYLLDNGNLLLRTKPSGGSGDAGIPGSALIELDWESNIVWAYRDPMLHHDFVRLPNGNTLAVFFEQIPSEVAAKVRGGRPAPSASGIMLGDSVREINPDGLFVNEWPSWQVLDPYLDAICPLEGRHQWTHQNALNLTADGDLLVSYRQIDTVGIIDRSSGTFIWKWGPGQISHQHHPTYLANGRILLFDNGPHRGGVTFSRVIEVDPQTNEIAWEYRGTPPISFYSYHISGAERLPNGNTLICEGAPGRIFEVTPDHQIVWEYVNPRQAPPALTSTGAPNSVFRAHRYEPDHPGLIGKDLTPKT